MQENALGFNSRVLIYTLKNLVLKGIFFIEKVKVGVTVPELSGLPSIPILLQNIRSPLPLSAYQQWRSQGQFLMGKTGWHQGGGQGVKQGKNQGAKLQKIGGGIAFHVWKRSSPIGGNPSTFQGWKGIWGLTPGKFVTVTPLQNVGLFCKNNPK